MQLLCKNDLATFGAILGKLGNFLFHHLVTLVATNKLAHLPITRYPSLILKHSLGIPVVPRNSEEPSPRAKFNTFLILMSHLWNLPTTRQS